MKTAATFMSAAVIAFALFAYAADSGPQTFEGEVSDSQCAMNVHSLTHSHQEMLKTKSHGTTPADCAAYCVKYLGGHFVLVAKHEIYHLDNEDLAKPYAAQKVKVIGYFDKESNTIHMIRIEPL